MVTFCKPLPTLLINLFYNATSDDSLKKYLDKLGFTKTIITKQISNETKAKQKSR